VTAQVFLGALSLAAYETVKELKDLPPLEVAVPGKTPLV
jgi:hypothetical protein